MQEMGGEREWCRLKVTINIASLLQGALTHCWFLWDVKANNLTEWLLICPTHSIKACRCNWNILVSCHFTVSLNGYKASVSKQSYVGLHWSKLFYTRKQQLFSSWLIFQLFSVNHLVYKKSKKERRKKAPVWFLSCYVQLQTPQYSTSTNPFAKEKKIFTADNESIIDIFA